MPVRTNTLAALLRRSPHVVDGDASFFAEAAGVRDPAASEDVTFRWLRKHTLGFGRIPERRVWVCGFAQWRGAPFALVQEAGKRADVSTLHVFDGAGYTNAVRRMTGASRVRVPPLVKIHWNLADAGIMYGMCLDCDWGNTFLDRWVVGYCAACAPAVHTALTRLGQIDAVEAGEFFRDRLRARSMPRVLRNLRT